MLVENKGGIVIVLITHHLALLDRLDVSACHVASPHSLQQRRHRPHVKHKLPAHNRPLLLLHPRRRSSSRGATQLRPPAPQHKPCRVRVPVPLKTLGSGGEREERDDLRSHGSTSNEGQQQATRCTVAAGLIRGIVGMQYIGVMSSDRDATYTISICLHPAAILCPAWRRISRRWKSWRNHC